MLSKHKGIVVTIVYYLFALLISYIVYLIFGWEYIHAPGFHHLTFILFLFGGLIWWIINIILFFIKKRVFYKQSMISHSVVFAGLISSILLIVKTAEPTNDENMSAMTLTNKNDTSFLMMIMKMILYL